MAPAVRALRGATTVDVDTPEHIEERVVALLDTLLARNEVDHEDLISILFTATEEPEQIVTHHAAIDQCRRRAQHALFLSRGQPGRAAFPVAVGS